MTTIHIDGGNPNICDTDRGPCACGAWHVVEQGPPKTLLLAAKELRAAQREYMLLRHRPETDAVRQFAGAKVGLAADEMDRAIEATEKRQATPIRAIHGMPVTEPSITEQHAMGVPSTGGEVAP